MGVEPLHSDMAMREEEDYYLSDSAVCSSIAEILEGVAKPPNMVAERDKDLYEQLLVIVIPSTRKKNLDEEILFVTALKALSGVVYRISDVYHASLLRNIFSMWIWDYGLDARTALLELIANLAVVPNNFLDSLEMLVRNFQPPERLHGYVYQPRWHEEMKRINGQLYETLCSITCLVPLAPSKLKGILARRMPTFHTDKGLLLSFVECMLGLESNEIGEYLQSPLSMVVELLVDLDVNITWEDILKEDYNRGIFDMEVEDLEDDALNNSVGSQIVCRKGQGFGDPKQKLTDKLDCVMVIVCEHIKSSAYNGRLAKVFETLIESFRETVLNAVKSKFSQFIMFYACSLDPDISGLKFAIFLTDIFVSKDKDLDSRINAVAYLASYLSRARFISSAVVSSIVKRLVEWCYDYRYLPAGSERIKKPFYAGCQAVMYILCFRMQLLMDIPELKEILFHLPLKEILCHPLDPLRVCLPTIVQEFLRQAMEAHLLKKPFLSGLQNDLLESEFSRDFGGDERLDMFFPFDPYLLKQSDRFMRPSFQFWSMVRKTYSNFNSDDELDDLDPDSIDEGSDDGFDEEFVDEDDEDGNEEEVDLGCSMDNMSITPRPVFEMATASGSIPIPSRMPARIRPSVSPV